MVETCRDILIICKAGLNKNRAEKNISIKTDVWQSAQCSIKYIVQFVDVTYVGSSLDFVTELDCISL